MKSEKLFSFLSEKRKLLIVVILLVLGLNITLFSHIASVKKTEQARIALEKAEADKKTADSLAVVEKKQEAESIVRQKKQAIEDAKEKRKRDWIESLKKYEISRADSSGEMFIDSISDVKGQIIRIESKYYEEVDSTSILFTKSQLNYYVFDELNGTLSSKLKLGNLVDEGDGPSGGLWYTLNVKNCKGSFVVGVKPADQFTPHKLVPVSITENMKQEIIASIIPTDVEFELKEFKSLGNQGDIVRVLVTGFHFHEIYICLDFNTVTKQSEIQFVWSPVVNAGIDGYACFSSDGRANIIAASEGGSAFIFAYRNGKWKQYSVYYWG